MKWVAPILFFTGWAIAFYDHPIGLRLLSGLLVWWGILFATESIKEEL